MKSIAIAAMLVLAPAFANAEDIKKLTSADLSVETHKWDGKTIEASFSCFYADKDEFRCIGVGGGHVRADFSTLTPLEKREGLENDCDTIKKSSSKKCTVTIRFVYTGYSTQEANAFSKLTLIEAQNNAGEIVK